MCRLKLPLLLIGAATACLILVDAELTVPDPLCKPNLDGKPGVLRHGMCRRIFAADYGVKHTRMLWLSDKDYNTQCTGSEFYTAIKKCFTLKAYPTLPNGGDLLSMHVSFRFHELDPSCKEFSTYSQVAFGALKIIIGRASSVWPVGNPERSFQVWPPSNTPPCKEPTNPGPPTVDPSDPEVHTKPSWNKKLSKNYPCFFVPNIPDYVKEASEVPSLFYFKPYGQSKKGICLLWSYNKDKGNLLEVGHGFYFNAEVYLPTQNVIVHLGTPVFTVLNEKGEHQPPGTPPPELKDLLSYCHPDRDLLTPYGHQSNWVKTEEDWFRGGLDRHLDFSDACEASNDCQLDVRDVTGPGGPTDPPIIGGVSNKGGSVLNRPIPPRPKDIYEGCDSKKTCLPAPETDDAKAAKSSCYQKSVRNCKMLLTFGSPYDKRDNLTKAHNFVYLEMYHQHVGKWMAVGFRPDGYTMPNTYVIECVAEDVPVLYESFNRNAESGKPDNKRLSVSRQETEGKVKLLKSVKLGNEFFCKFAIPNNFKIFPLGKQGSNTETNHSYSLRTTPYYILFAWGNDVTADGERGNIRRHLSSARRAYGLKVSLGALFSPNPEQQDWLRYHAQLMTFGIMFCLTIGMFVGRYFKETFPRKMFCGKSAWYWVHVITMTLAMAAMTGSMVLEVQAHEGWKGLKSSEYHTNMGCISFGLVVCAYLMGFFIRPSQYGRRRGVGTILHTIVGNLAYLTGFAVIIPSHTVPFSRMRCETWHLMVALLCTVLFLQLGFSIHYCWVDWYLGLHHRRGLFFLPIQPVYELLTHDSDQETRVTKHSLAGATQSEQGIENLRRRIAIRKSKTFREAVATEALAAGWKRNPIEINYTPSHSDSPVKAPGRRFRLVGMAFLLFFSLVYTIWTLFLIESNKRGERNCGGDKDLNLIDVINEKKK